MKDPCSRVDLRRCYQLVQAQTNLIYIWKGPLILLITCLNLVSVADAIEGLPHIRECSFCLKCLSEDNSVGGKIGDVAQSSRATQMEHHSGRALHRAHRAGEVDPWDDPSQPLVMRSSSYRISDQTQKSKLPNCTECRGCTTNLSPLDSKTSFLGRQFTNEAGATNGWLFRATTNETHDGTAVLKVYCVPLPKRKGAKVPSCAQDLILTRMHLLLAIDKLSSECGFQDIIPHTWVAPVSAPIPGIGFHIRWHGLWMEVAEGVSLESLLYRGEPSPLPHDVIIDMMNNKINRTQVIRAAIFDLLTSQCDRHAQNIFISKTGQLKLIDNDAALQTTWKTCGFNSILVPTTQKQEIVRLSNELVMKLIQPKDARCPESYADPQLLLDYRCYLPDGKQEMGTSYPPQVQHCLKAISQMTVREVQSHYGFTEELPAFNLHTRATDMLKHGYEYAAKYGKPTNVDSRRYRMQPPCCKIEWKNNSYRCAHAWLPKVEIPFGDPITGRPWSKTRFADPGTYQGGSF